MRHSAILIRKSRAHSKKRGNSMERPKISSVKKERQPTGEIMYLDEMRRQAEFPKDYVQDTSDMAKQMFETEADMAKAHGVRPEIMDLYDEYDACFSLTEASCVALADELLALKDSENRLTFVDICVDQPADEVLEKLAAIKAGELLNSDDEQLAIESNGEYYPILDYKKQDAKLVGVGLRAWGSDHDRYLFTNDENEQRTPRRDVLVFPSGEKQTLRQLEISFTYRSEKQFENESERFFTESISLFTDNNGGSHFSSEVSAMAYAETGYEGHRHGQLYEINEQDIAAFGDLVAEIVGDKPESVAMRQERYLTESIDAAVSEKVRGAIQELADLTWPAQMTYYLSLKPKGSTKHLGALMRSEENTDIVMAEIQPILDQWREAHTEAVTQQATELMDDEE